MAALQELVGLVAMLLGCMVMGTWLCRGIWWAVCEIARHHKRAPRHPGRQ